MAEVENRIAKAWSAYFSLAPLLTNHSVSLKTRMNILDTRVRPVLMWGLQSVTLTDSQLRKISDTHTSMVSSI